MKEWLIKLGLQEAGPSAIRGALLGVAGWLLMRNGALAHFGVISDAAAHTTTIHWDQLSAAAIAALPALGAAVIKLLNYHGTNVVKSLKAGAAAALLLTLLAVPSRAATVYAQLGPLALPVPWEALNGVYLYNATRHVSEVGGETVLAQLKAGSFQGNPLDIDVTAGGVLDPANKNVGTAFIGTNIYLPNPIPMISLLNTVQPGLFGGYAVAQHEWVFGIKAAVPIFK